MTQVGTHAVLELYGCNEKLLNDPDYIREALARAAKEANATLLGQLVHPFEPQGVTALALLAESHISIHTWPEHGYAAVDVFTCGRHTRPQVACETLSAAFEAEGHNLRLLPRGEHAPEEVFSGERLPLAPAPPAREHAALEHQGGALAEDASRCRVLRFTPNSGSASTSRPTTSTNMV